MVNRLFHAATVIMSLLCVVFLFSCGKDSSTGPSTTSFTITGRVIDASDNGVPGVIVSVSSKSATTDSNGNYSIAGLSNGTYTLTCTKDGYSFTPSSVQVVVSSADITVEDVTASELGAGTGDIPVELTFVTIPAVTSPYAMSSSFSVTLSSYEMSTTEITNAQYVQYLTEALASGDIIGTSENVQGASGDWTGQEYILIDDPSCQISYYGGMFIVDLGMENRPVWVTWYGAKAFATYYGYDLPTEAEWQYAASGGMNYEYGTIDGDMYNFYTDNYYANYNYNNGQTTDVGSYPANPFGLYDMSGNLYEWCLDWYGDYPGGIENNYTGVLLGTERVHRGGSWASSGWECRTSTRARNKPDHTHPYIGFRVVRRP